MTAQNDASEKMSNRCKLCDGPCLSEQVFCGAACCAEWESGKRPTLREIPLNPQEQAVLQRRFGKLANESPRLEHFHIRLLTQKDPLEGGVLSFDPREGTKSGLYQAAERMCQILNLDTDFLDTEAPREEPEIEPEWPVRCDSLRKKEGYTAHGPTMRWGILRIRWVREDMDVSPLHGFQKRLDESLGAMDAKVAEMIDGLTDREREVLQKRFADAPRPLPKDIEARLQARLNRQKVLAVENEALKSLPNENMDENKKEK